MDDGFENEGRNRNNNSDDGEKNNLPEAGPRSCLDNLSYVLSSRATDISFDQRAPRRSLGACFFSLLVRTCRSIQAAEIKR